MKKHFPALVLFFFCFGSALAQAPKIVYTEPERDDSRRTEFEIIGRINGNFLVYKNNRNEHDIAVYDNEMKLKDRVKMDASDRWINVDFVPYSDYAYMVYQYQKRSVVYCMGVKLDGNGKQVGNPIELDTTHIGFAANNKVYTTIFSDDKKKIMIFKINNRNQRNFLFTTFLFSSQMELLGKNRLPLAMEERNDFFTDFLLSNEGDFIFGKFKRVSNSDLISNLMMVLKAPDAIDFSVKEVDTRKLILDELKVKVDNSNKRILVSALYYRQRRGNIEGLYSLLWDKTNNVKLSDSVTVFSDDLRSIAKSSDANKRMAFNDYFIKNIVIRKDGGFLVVGESLYSTSRGNTFNRWNYLNGGSPWMSPLDYYWSPMYSSPWSMPWNRYGSAGGTRYYAENIMVLSFNKEGGLEWSNVIDKSQYDDETDNMISFSTMNTGSEIHFLFNQYERRKLILNDQSLNSEGKIIRTPTLKNLDKGYEFMPRFAKQVSSRQIIVPCLYRNYLCFAKIDF
ncbi:MAG: hypothetical protein ABI151_12820 [Chitinophagaceae bacterium]